MIAPFLHHHEWLCGVILVAVSVLLAWAPGFVETWREIRIKAEQEQASDALPVPLVTDNGERLTLYPNWRGLNVPEIRGGAR